MGYVTADFHRVQSYTFLYLGCANTCVKLQYIQHSVAVCISTLKEVIETICH